MRSYVVALVDRVEDRLTQVSVLRKMDAKVLPVLNSICVIVAIFAFIGIIGGVGTWDFYGELGQLPPREEEIGAYITIGVSMGLLALCFVVGNLLLRISEWTREMIVWRQKKDKRDFEKRVREIVAEMLKESESAAAEQESIREILEDDTVVK
jgi:hypothetical protein